MARPSPADTADYVARLAGVIGSSGVPPMPARVFAALLCTAEGSATAAELAESLQVSPAAVSGAVRYLEQVGLIARHREVGGRREVYRLYSDQWYEILANREATLRRWAEIMDEGAKLYGPRSAVGSRLAETTRFMRFLQDELVSMVRRWRASERRR